MASPALFDDTRTISQLYAELTRHLDDRWGRSHQTWVLGEVQKIVEHRSGHCYVDLVDPAAGGREVPTLKAKCWRSTWGPMRTGLAREGLELAEGTVVRLRGYVDVYAPRGELSFIVTALDREALRIAALGEHARRREALVRALSAEGLLDANKAVPFPEVPLHVGLVASRDTEGFNDFLGMLQGSGFAFRVTLARAAVQGQRAAADVARAVAALGRRACDVVCVVRGGGSQADLAAFDAEVVARTIAISPVPVLTGVGHTGDVSVADLVAHRALPTPTACAEALVAAVREWYSEHVAIAARRVVDASAGVQDELDDALAQSRRHLAVVAGHRLERAQDGLSATTSAISRHAVHSLRRAGASVASRSRHLGPLASQRTSGLADALAARRALLAAYDPTRLLARGWSITTDEGGRVLRSVVGLEPGTTLVTRLADGVARSAVTDTSADVG